LVTIGEDKIKEIVKNYLKETLNLEKNKYKLDVMRRFGDFNIDIYKKGGN